MHVAMLLLVREESESSCIEQYCVLEDTINLQSKCRYVYTTVTEVTVI